MQCATPAGYCLESFCLKHLLEAYITVYHLLAGSHAICVLTTTKKLPCNMSPSKA